MDAEFTNVYDDDARANAYAELEFPGTYWLAYRDLPELLRAHTSGSRALDFGCGAGRSTRFLRDLGFGPVVGVDIAESMVAQARERDPDGDYRLLTPDGIGELPAAAFDLVLAAFTFDNVPSLEEKGVLLRALGDRLAPGGRIVVLVSTPEIYVNEWASFSTKDYPENCTAQTGDVVRIVMLDVDDRRPVHDVLCTDEDYRALFDRSGLVPLEVRHPLGREDEPHAWVSETKVAPWVIYVLARAADPGRSRGEED